MRFRTVAADCALFPTLIFAHTMLPKFDREFTVGPNTQKWFDMLKSTDPVGQRICDGASSFGWQGREGAGGIAYMVPVLRDVRGETIFDKIVAGDIPSEKVYEDDLCVAFKDVAPCAPVHILLIPKHPERPLTVPKSAAGARRLAGSPHVEGRRRGERPALDDRRVVVNDGADAEQTVFHLHVHVIDGGRELAWPPG